jgi:hypothetical protein
VIIATYFNGKPLKRFRAEKNHVFTWLKPGANDGKLIFKNPAPPESLASWVKSPSTRLPLRLTFAHETFIIQPSIFP